ncbi:MAG: Ig-like domain-containing protein [Lachnospiraceae bacterium]|nr:Ig-like domain-containing protein [Lachnospiraceae bacterium]
MMQMKKLLALGLTQAMAVSLLAGVPAVEVKANDVQTYNGHYYKFVNEVVDAYTAEYMCDISGAHLVTLTSAEEEAFVKTNLSGETDIWLGAKKVNGAWNWITGEPFSYANWHEDEPSNGDEEIFLSLWEGTWDDCLDIKSLGAGGNAYVMEWDSEAAYNAYVSGNKAEMGKNILGTSAYNGHKYKYYGLYSSWTEADEKCKNLGGYLVTPTSKKEDKFVYGLCNEKNTWIGLNDAKKEGKCVWVTKERTDYNNFGSDVNNDFDGTEDYFGYYNGSTWNDYTNEAEGEGKLGFVCEWDDANPIILTTVKSTINVKAGKTAKLLYQSYPVKKKVTFKSNKKKIASVNKKGVVTGKKKGKAVITIKCGSKKVKVNVKVK